MPDFPSWVLPAISVFFGGGGILSGIVLWRKDKRQGPIEMTTAQVADAVAVSHAARSLFETVTTRLADQDLKIEKQDLKIEAQNTTIEELKAKLQIAHFNNENWTMWYNNLYNGWDIYRIDPMPPKRPEGFEND